MYIFIKFKLFIKLLIKYIKIYKFINIITSIYAVKTRKLPANFNESKLIFLHVLATSFLWMSFLPTYFAAEDTNQKYGLLSMLLLINGTLTTLCLHAPKVYPSVICNRSNRCF